MLMCYNTLQTMDQSQICKPTGCVTNLSQRLTTN